MTSARRAAAALVSAVTDDGRTLDDALAATASYAALDGRDRAFARAIASATLRRLGGIDAVLAQFMARPLGDAASVPRAILRTGAAQLLALDAAPHAVVSEAVALAQSSRSARPFAGLINAVLRKVATQGRAVVDAAPPGADLPDWLFARWRAAYGAKAAAIALALRDEPPMDLTVKTDAAGWAARLGGAVGPTGGVRLPPGARVTELDGFAEGAWWVQDAAAMLPALMLGDVSGQRVADLCAAPGGKTLQLAAAGARVTALDIAESRLARLRDNLARTQLSAEVVCADACVWRPTEPFDAVLLDAPCTATGTLRRHPDAAWLRRPTDIATLTTIQSELLVAARDMTRPGGVIVYAVCSLELEEGEAMIEVARGLGLTVEPAPEDSPARAFASADGAVRTTPADDMDGFFAVRLRR
ncbi:MAG: methyltransferase domain-containing protein [Alphaproteobacteria bacterium]|nr:methyltransferase domain-containing protein [Alphaproteobacteria bacterium]